MYKIMCHFSQLDDYSSVYGHLHHLLLYCCSNERRPLTSIRHLNSIKLFGVIFKPYYIIQRVYIFLSNGERAALAMLDSIILIEVAL